MVDDDLSEDINQIMENTENMSDFMKLFWEQQKEASAYGDNFYLNFL